MKLYRGNIGDFTGGIVASWFVTGVKGPVAFATGFVEMPCAPWSLFYRWMSPFGGRTYLGAAVDQERLRHPATSAKCSSTSCWV
jgi:hypothetical protein